MNTDCENCKHARLWTEVEKAKYVQDFINLVGRVPSVYNHWICDKIPKGQEWKDGDNTYSYDGYSLDGENYDEVFHCFEEREEE